MSGEQKPLVVVLDDYHYFAREILSKAEGFEDYRWDFVAEHLADRALLEERLAPANVIIANRERTPLSAEILTALPELKVIITTGMGNDSIAQVPGIPILGTQSLVTPTVELTWALIHALSRRVVEQALSLRRSTWQSHLGVSLEGKTLGLIGLGKVGSRVARVGKAFDMRIIAWSQNLTPERAAEAGVEAVSQEEIFQEADILSVHLRLGERNRNLIGEKEFTLMKPTTLLINTSRAAIIEKNALFSALNERRIAGAALDVFEEEPLKAGSDYLGLPNTLLTPHLGYVTQENFELFFSDALESIREYFRGNPVRVIFDGEKP